MVRAPPKFAVQNYSPADASAQGKTDNRATTARRALPQLSKRRGVRIIFYDHRELQFSRQCPGQSKSIQAWQVRGSDDFARFRVDGARNYDGTGADLITLALTLSQLARQKTHNLLRVVCYWSSQLEAVHQPALSIDSGSAEISPTQIHSKDQSWVSRRRWQDSNGSGNRHRCISTAVRRQAAN
jgi:hypothetical protein